MKIILASNSERRKDLLNKAGVKFTIVPSTTPEREILKGESVEDYAKNLALTKAQSVFEKTKNIVIGADTIVVLNDKILKKPKSRLDAKQMLLSLSNSTHKVITGYAVICKDKVISNYDETLVTFNDLTTEVINSYIDSGLWKGKAGGYGIQDGYPLVKEIVGDYDNVVGLPTIKILNVLAELK